MESKRFFLPSLPALDVPGPPVEAACRESVPAKLPEQEPPQKSDQSRQAASPFFPVLF